jgi:chemotaxis protein methyltransferase CheR
MNDLLANSITLSERDFKLISETVYDHCGINQHMGKKELVRARLAKLIRIKGFEDFAQYIQFVMDDKTGEEFTTLIDALSTNLTSFFREKQHFDFLEHEFLPQLAERKRRASSRRIRGWSAGCSSGEEPYSIAITLLESLPAGYQWDARILATDIANSKLDIARRGTYDATRVESVPPAARTKYFVKSGSRGGYTYEVADVLRQTLCFQYLNLMEEWPVKAPIDFIFCRNVMIYFDKPTQERLVNRYWELLDSGGVLFTGHSESLTGIRHRFNYVQPTIYVKP